MRLPGDPNLIAPRPALSLSLSLPISLFLSHLAHHWPEVHIRPLSPECAPPGPATQQSSRAATRSGEESWSRRSPRRAGCVPTLETTLGQMAPPKSGHSPRMPPELGGIPGRDHFWEAPSALMLCLGWLSVSSFWFQGRVPPLDAANRGGNNLNGFSNFHSGNGSSQGQNLALS